MESVLGRVSQIPDVVAVVNANSPYGLRAAAAELRTIRSVHHFLAVVAEVPYNYFELLGVTALSGTSSPAAVAGNRSWAAVATRPAATALNLGHQPEQLHVTVGNRQYEVVLVGIIPDLPSGLALDRETAFAQIFVFTPKPQGTEAVIRTRVRASTVLPDVENALRGTPAAAGAAIEAFEEVVKRRLSIQRFLGITLLAFANAALFYAALVVYASSAYALRQRTREIAIQMALGAATLAVVRYVMGKTIASVAIGVAVGVVCTFLASLVTEPLFYRAGTWNVALASTSAILFLLLLPVTAGVRSLGKVAKVPARTLASE